MSLFNTETLFVLLALVGMDSPDFRTRERATRALASRPVNLKLLALAERHYPSAEVRSRCGQLTAGYYQALAEAYTPAWPLPWVDSLPPDCPGRGWYITRSLEMTPATPGSEEQKNGWPRYRSATAHAARLMIVDRVPIDEVDRILAETRKNTENGYWWSADHGE